MQMTAVWRIIPRSLCQAALFGLLLVAYVGPSSAAEARDTLTITKDETAYVLQVPVSRLVLGVPSEGLTDQTQSNRRSAADRRYFYLANDASGVTISGWFEAESSYRGIVKFWKDEKASWQKSGLPAPQNVDPVQVGDWVAIFYDIAEGGETSTHVRAELVKAGTWIDLHISFSNSGSTGRDRHALEALLRQMVVSERRGS